MKGDSRHEHGKIYHVTNTRMCDGASVPRDTIKRVSLPQRTMQSMLNRITINCINSKNSGDSKHSPSAHNRRMHRPATRLLEHPPFPTRALNTQNL